MFKKARKYIANKIYNDLFDNQLIAYIDELHNYLNDSNKFVSELVKIITQTENDDKILILNQNSEISQLKEELFLANKALLKSTDDNSKNDFGDFLMDIAPWFIIIYFLISSKSSEDYNSEVLDSIEKSYKEGKFDNLIKNLMGDI